ncbi:Probable O-methyltransferase [Mycobacteroides abscessus]|nr:Probable O-methyltransferase [Mycobacteroides abscessus]
MSHSEKIHVDLSGAPQTMLATFYAKALDAGLPEPILGDQLARDLAQRIDYDWSKTTITAGRPPPSPHARRISTNGAAPFCPDTPRLLCCIWVAVSTADTSA